MAPTLVNAAFGALLAAALLGAAFDRRSVIVVVVAAMLPDLDAAVSLILPGATNALFHNVWIPLAFAAILYWEASVRDRSWLRERHGWYGVRVAWVALTAFVIAGIGPELFGLAGANLLYPVHDAYYLVRGRLVFSTADGIVQTVITSPGDGPGILPLESPGTTKTYVIPTWINPSPGAGSGSGAERQLYLVRSGWQAVVVSAAAALLVGRFLEDSILDRTGQTPSDRMGGDQ